MVEAKNWLCQLTALVMPAKTQSSHEGDKIRVYRLLPFLKEQNLAKAMLSDSSKIPQRFYSTYSKKTGMVGSLSWKQQKPWKSVSSTLFVSVLINGTCVLVLSAKNGLNNSVCTSLWSENMTASRWLSQHCPGEREVCNVASEWQCFLPHLWGLPPC